MIYWKSRSEDCEATKKKTYLWLFLPKQGFHHLLGCRVSGGVEETNKLLKTTKIHEPALCNFLNELSANLKPLGGRSHSFADGKEQNTTKT